ncbi:hypothetical protein JYU34_016770 [Plutella xylostella]|uniref:Multiple inositol polyphosphate phosphatase 1 n=1 Tax=Plutella xylostella TaxID=51655 RepID=A0ABQ7Q3J9_PLUXY|nr:hypothetical protein JYU34_016770 [Plutella xylostella]
MNMQCLLVFTILCVYLTNATLKQCYWNDGCSYKYFSSKTSYDAVRGDIRDAKLGDCEPVSIWHIMRHGPRNPGPDFARKIKTALSYKDDIIKSYEKGNSSLCAQDVDNLKAYEVPEDMFIYVSKLTEEGYNDMFQIGKRIAQTFPKLVESLDDGSYEFRAVYGHWIEKSLKAYVEGLAGDKTVNISEVNLSFDNIAPYAACGIYQKEVKANPALYAEVDYYEKTDDYLAAKHRIERRNGLNYDLSGENITSLHDLCRYTWSSKEKSSPWCAVFTKEDLEVLEYVGDLRHYYRNSYGHPVNKLYGGPPLWDLLTTFQLAKDGKGKKVTSYLSHATMMDMIYTALGLYKDEYPLNGTARVRNRKWRSSFRSGYCANMLAVLNRCSERNSTEFKVAFYLNENPMTELCDDGICTWEEFEKLLQPFIGSKIDLKFCKFMNTRFR